MTDGRHLGMRAWSLAIALGLLGASTAAYAIGEEGALLLMSAGSSNEAPAPTAHGPYDIVHFPTPHMTEVINKEAMPATLHVRGYRASTMTLAGYVEAAKCPGWRVASLVEARMVYQVALTNKGCALEMTVSVPKYKTHPGTLKVRDILDITKQPDGTVTIGKDHLVYVKIAP